MTTENTGNCADKAIKEILDQGNKGKTENEKWTEHVQRTSNTSDKPSTNSTMSQKNKSIGKQAPDIEKEK